MPIPKQIFTTSSFFNEPQSQSQSQPQSQSQSQHQTNIYTYIDPTLINVTKKTVNYEEYQNVSFSLQNMQKSINKQKPVKRISALQPSATSLSSKRLLNSGQKLSHQQHQQDSNNTQQCFELRNNQKKIPSIATVSVIDNTTIKTITPPPAPQQTLTDKAIQNFIMQSNPPSPHQQKLQITYKLTTIQIKIKQMKDNLKKNKELKQRMLYQQAEERERLRKQRLIKLQQKNKPQEELNVLKKPTAVVINQQQYNDVLQSQLIKQKDQQDRMLRDQFIKKNQERQQRQQQRQNNRQIKIQNQQNQQNFIHNPLINYNISPPIISAQPTLSETSSAIIVINNNNQQQQLDSNTQPQLDDEKQQSIIKDTDVVTQDLIMQVTKPQKIQILTENPYSNQAHTYYVSEIVKTFDQRNSIARQHILQSLQILRQLQSCHMLSNKEISSKTLTLQQHSKHKGKKVLVFDLDQTLIHCVDSLSKKADYLITITLPTGQPMKAGINVRPKAKQILQSLSPHFQIMIFTASQSCYANEVLKLLDPDQKLISHRMYRQHCILSSQGMYIKDLRIINRQMKDILLIDNAAYSYVFQLDNGIPILPYYQGNVDFELKALERYLFQMVGDNDVRQRNRRTFQLFRYCQFYNTPNRLVQELYGGNGGSGQKINGD